MFYNEKNNYYAFSKKAKVSRQILYRHSEIVEKFYTIKNLILWLFKRDFQN